MRLTNMSREQRRREGVRACKDDILQELGRVTYLIEREDTATPRSMRSANG